MKATTLISAITAFGLVSVVSGTKLSYTMAEDICGDLGVMNVTDLPEGVDPNAVRTCKEHPEGIFQKSLDKRDCWFGSPLGCSASGYCYKSLALVNGAGPPKTMDMETGSGAQASATAIAGISVVLVVAKHADAAAKLGKQAWPLEGFG
ncbi:uncharacterized protein ACLA_062930 [Aspergillus clavatus NRRL 1]|uniref:Uncharacterized protein n=1 Tax=Aspergillus clavatus (strain ATCC 1007 / CBS 513.65 / DSM 816 / NCTC 3887 / NRRL 1 / QM 1276 / 107) TaxID=344612 RepID=A1CCR9_ASPCL|nr:uncharacterized protein ACLA_062930 [Aspergillus clavatus NRRL 1]EAW12326.1 conserved hypothetical protein [Aspergillus clavatus NRRL 1]